MAGELSTPRETDVGSRIAGDASSALKHLVEQSERTKLLLFLEGQSHVLERIAQRVPLTDVLKDLALVLEAQIDGMASILLVSEDRKHLCYGAASSLPSRYRFASDGVAIGPSAGSAGTAAFFMRRVISTDIARDPLWTDYKNTALELGIRASWSTPIVSARGELLGAFAFYHRQPFTPSPVHLSMVDLATNLARIAIERDAAERERLCGAESFAERYRTLLQATGGVVWEWDLVKSLVHWHSGMDAFGYTTEGLGSTWEWLTERIHPQDAARLRHSAELAVRSGTPIWEEEYRFRRQNGTYADVSCRGLIIRDETSNAVRIVGSLQDITRRKQRLQEVELMAERLQSASVAAQVGTWRLDRRTEFFIADASLNRLLGLKEEETVQRLPDALRAVHPEDRPRVAQALDESITTGRPYECDHRVVLADGEIRWLRSRGRVVVDKDVGGEVLTGAAADITELKYAEQSMAILADASRLLAESLDIEETLSAMVRMAVPSFSDAALLHLKDQQSGELRLAVAHAANPELLAILREMLRSGTYRVAAPSRRAMETGRAELTSKWTPEWFLREEVDENIISVVRRFRISSFIHVPIVSANSPVGVMVFAATGTRYYNPRDLAFAEELARRASHAMRNAQVFQTAKADRQRAEEAAALRERLVAIVGHDLRNPLAAISMAARILSRSGLPTPEAELVLRIQSSANRMTRMLAHLLDFARIRAGMSFDLKFVPADLHQICNAVVDELRMSRPDQTIEVDIEGDGDLVCDADRIAQVLSNVIGNAIQHGTKGPLSVRMRDTEPNAVAVTVHNFGPPIPDDLQATIFEAFRKGERTRDDESIGLGLFIAGEIVRAHHGSISVRSPDRDGTTFTVVLPRQPVQDPVHLDSDPPRD
jgi:PAS domain S-box-containing protein